FGVAEPERIVEQSEEGDPDEVDDPPSQVGFEQIKPGPLVQDREWRECDQRGGGQDRAQRKGKFFVPVVDPGEAGPDQSANTGRHDQQANEDRDRKTEPGYDSAPPWPLELPWPFPALPLPPLPSFAPSTWPTAT